MGKPFGEVRMIAGTLATNTDVLTLRLARRNGLADQRRHSRIRLVKVGGQEFQARIAIKPKRELSQIVGTNRETIEVLQELLGQNGITRNLAHHDDFQIVFTPFESMSRQ